MQLNRTFQAFYTNRVLKHNVHSHKQDPKRKLKAMLYDLLTFKQTWCNNELNDQASLMLTQKIENQLLHL